MDISTNNSEKCQSVLSPTSSYASNQHKVKRLKILQELEDRKLQLNRDRLAKAQIKVCRQLDFQRLQFTRRFSESNFNISLEELSPKSVMITTATENMTVDMRRMKQIRQNSIHTDAGNSNRRLHSQENCEKDSSDQPFWLRLRSLGVPSDEDTLLAALACKNMNIDDKEKPVDDNDEDDVFESIPTPSNQSRNLTAVPINAQKQRSLSVTGADETFENLLSNTKRIKRSLSLEDKKPDWLLALNQMKREKSLRSDSNNKEEITALVRGNKFYGAKRPNVLTVKYQPRNDRLIKSHRHTVVGITHEFTPI
ncbi:hypothetical protein MN116_005154 [Schistosoma mekongi]|uniref:Uncharacterized protein n=1 Tax=Schistosoma mekongi TaxID=38744 RepID=A0AAE1ZCN6_SCHME|nr:hypothetical protein MN116_005154 [Schistosoma mekongi]